MYKYAIEIFYSDEDEGYIAVVPELLGCSAFGGSEEDALKEVMTAIELWLETAKKERRKLPTCNIASHNSWYFSWSTWWAHWYWWM